MPKEPLYPHTPKGRETLFPHVPKGRQPGEPTTTHKGETHQERMARQKKQLERGEQILKRAREITKGAGRGLPETQAAKTLAAFMEMAAWYCKYQRAMTSKDIRPIAAKYFGTGEELTEFYQYLVTSEGRNQFRRELRDAMRRHGISIPPEAEWLSLTVIEGGEPVPPQYRNLIGFISEPLLPAIEPEEGERKIDAVMKQLKAGVEGIQDSSQFRLFLTTMSKFHDYSIGNQILIMLQQPNATHVAGFVTWKELGRWVKRGGKSISILAPIFPPRATCPKCGTKISKGAQFCPKCGEQVEVEEEVEVHYFKVVSVFDISQTEGKPLPEFEVPVLTGVVNEELFSKLLALMKKQDVSFSSESKPDLPSDIKGQYIDNRIWVRPEEPRAQQLKTLLHETAHYYTSSVFRIPRQDAETIAESAAYVIGAHHGFDTGVRSFSYVAIWSQDKKTLERNLESIRRISVRMIDELK